MKALQVIKCGLLFGSMLIAGGAQGQAPDILSFQGNGNLTWTNVSSALFYHVQWAASLEGTDVWMSSYSTLSDIQSTNPTVTNLVPMYYRIAVTTNRVCFAAPVPKTGQTYSYATDDDGAFVNGVAWPHPRFTVGAGVDGTNCVTDNLTGLTWARNAHLFGTTNWGAAVEACNNLDYGGQTDWRLPNVRELMSLIAYQYSTPAISDGTGTNHWTEARGPFTRVQSGYYWASTTYGGVGATNNAWRIQFGDGFAGYNNKATTLSSVWPVRGGQ